MRGPLSPVLARLIEEVRREKEEQAGEASPHAYNRPHNRHNRSGQPGGYNRAHNRHNRS